MISLIFLYLLLLVVWSPFRIILPVCLVLSIWIVPIRIILFNPCKTLRYAIMDLFSWFYYKKWRLLKTGEIKSFCAGVGPVFGSGKTLSGVAFLWKRFSKYDGLVVYDTHRQKWVEQRVRILSNVTLSQLPSEHMVSMSQIVTFSNAFRKFDEDNDTRTCLLVCIDEAQNQLNSRKFKDNFPPMLLKQLTETRHFNMSFIYTSPQFGQVDALLRQCTSVVAKCTKLWRFQCHAVYPAYELDHVSNTALLKPLYHSGFLVEDDIFDQYDTYEIVENLIQAKDEGDFLSEEEILALQCNQPIDLAAANHFSTAGKKLIKAKK